MSCNSSSLGAGAFMKEPAREVRASRDWMGVVMEAMAGL
jgi:hypothetical protein